MTLLLLWRMVARGLVLYWLGALQVALGGQSKAPRRLVLAIANLRRGVARDHDAIRALSKASPPPDRG